MKKVFCLLTIVFSFNAYSDFLHPMDFDGSESQKHQVVKYIKDRVKKEYCDGMLDMCQPATLRMMEKSNLDAFKKAVRATDRNIMDDVINSYCHGGLDMCDYTTIHMMYEQNSEASKQTLSW